ncbi:MAG: DUF5678 domain-containing protein [Patescibacteria group bacterium]
MRTPRLPIIDIKKYGGKQVAVANGKIVAVGKNSVEAFTKAKERLPEKTWQQILLVSVPKGLTVVYHL